MKLTYTLATILSFTFCNPTFAEAPEAEDIAIKLMKEAQKADPKKADPLTVEVNPGELEKKYTKDPEFSSDSFDQEKRDKVVSVISDKFHQNSAGHILNFSKCKKFANLQEIKNCKEQVLSKKSK